MKRGTITAIGIAVAVFLGSVNAGAQAYSPNGLRVDSATQLRESPRADGQLIGNLLRNETVYPDTAGILDGHWLRVWHGTQNAVGTMTYVPGWVRIDDLASCGPCGCGKPCLSRMKNRAERVWSRAEPPGPPNEIWPTAYVPFHGDGNWMLAAPMNYTVGRSKIEINVPQGFVTDFASVPRFLWGALPPQDEYMLPAVIHDYLYWEQPCTKKQADNLLAIAMMEQKVDRWKQNAVYSAVARFGSDAWDANHTEKAARVLRVIPRGHEHIPPATTWAQYRSRLSQGGVEGDPNFISPPPAYCALGNSRTVP